MKLQTPMLSYAPPTRWGALLALLAGALWAEAAPAVTPTEFHEHHSSGMDCCHTPPPDGAGGLFAAERAGASAAAGAGGTESPQYSQLWGENGELWDPEGFLKDFTSVGYQGQGAVFPDRPITTNVEDFGADGSDDLDDTEAFRAAIRAVPEDGVIFIPNGRYIISDYIHVASYGPDSTHKSNKFPNSPFTIYNKSNFTLRGESMAETKIVFPQRLGDFYPQLAAFEVMDHLDANPDRYNNDAFKNEYGIPLDYEIGVPGGGDSDFVLDLNLRKEIAFGISHEYSQAFTKTGAFFEFKRVTDTNVENLSFLFDDRQRYNHQENSGGNPLLFDDSSDYYVRNVYIRNADSGIFNYKGERFTIHNVIIDQYRQRLEERYPTSGHNGIKLVGNKNALVHNVWFTGPWWHAFDLNGANSGCVISKVRGAHLNVVYHGGFHSGNLYTDFQAPSLRYLKNSNDAKKYKNETYWSMRTAEVRSYDSIAGGTTRGAVLVGIHTTAPSVLDSPDYWHETIDPEALHARNIYLAQMAYRGKPLPEDLSFSMGMLFREFNVPLYIFPSESATVLNGNARNGEDGRDVNFYSEDPKLTKRAPDINSVHSRKDKKRYTYVKFDLSVFDIQGIESATLEFFNDNMFAKGATDPANRVTIDYMVDDSWVKTGITFNNQPAATAGKADHPFVDVKDWMDFDVSSFARDAFNGDKTLTLRIGLEGKGMIYLPRKRSMSPALFVVPSEG